MKRRILTLISLLFVLAALTMTLSACDGLSENTPQGGDKVEIHEHEHNFTDWEIIIEPTCSEFGLERGVCECGAEENVALSKSDHTYGDWIVTVEPTCSESGFRYRECDLCGNIDGEELTVDHTITYLPSREPTCTNTGSTEWSFCSVCGMTLTSSEEIPMIQHSYTDETVDPTCTKQGYTLHTCSMCKGSYKDTYTPALGHDEVTDAAIPSTCTTDGLSEGRHCQKCNTITWPQRVLSALGHNPSEWIVEIAPTCTTQGSKYRECTRCSITVDTRLIPELGHTETLIPAISPTCTEEGLTEGTYCSVCKKGLIDQIVVPATGHNYTDKVTEPTCTEGGYTTYTCKCGDEYVDDYTDPHGHREVIDEAKLPTCTNAGLTEGSHCSVCSFVFTPQEIIPSIGHSIKSVYTAPTCTKEGYTTHTCETCGYGYRTEYESSIPHNYVATIVAPTCTEEGYTSHVCSYCNDSYKTAYTNAAGHSWGEWVAENRKTLRYCACGEAQRVVSASAECVLINLCVGYSIPTAGIEVIATLDDNSTVRITDFTLENDLLTKEGTNEVTVKFGGFSIIVSVPAILDNLPGTNDVGEFEYTEKNGEITITKYIGISTDVVIPAHIGFVPVRTIGVKAFENCTTIQSITIPGSLHTIERAAFYGCSGLRALNLSEGLETISGQAFYGCPITSIVIPNSVTDIAVYDPAEFAATYYGAFENCTLLETVVIGNGISIIKRDTFSGCSSLKNLTIGDSVTEIDPYAFYNCDSLVDLVIPNSVTIIDSYSFNDCDSLVNLVIGDGVVTIETSAFQFCERLKNVSFGESVTTISYEAFEGCVSIEELYIPGSVKTIESGAFYGCTGLTYLYLGEGINTIQGAAFYGCSITSLTIPDSVAKITSNYGSGYADGAFEDCTLLESLVIGNGLSVINRDTFRNCISLKNITFGHSVVTIDQYAFYNCDSLVDLVIGDSVVTIEDYAFKDCDRLKKITFGSSVTTIDDESFEDCISIEDLYIPGNVKTIGAAAFNRCTALTSLWLEEGITTIEGAAFSQCSITSLVLPDSLTKMTSAYGSSVSDGAFENCASLQTLVIGTGLRSIPRDAFRGCTALKNIDFGYGVQNIGLYAFAECSSLPSISLPESVITIDDCAFSNCTALSDIDLGYGTQEIGKEAFAGCTALRSIIIPGNVQIIDNEAFAGCVLLHKITIEKGLLHTVGSYVFDECRTARIYYTGTESEWANIAINAKNDYPLNSTPFFYSAHKPASEGNFWFIDDKGEPAVWDITEAAHKADIYYTELLEKYGATYRSLPSLAHGDISTDPAFIATFTAWTTLEIIINPFEQITKSISQQQFYEIAIYDILMISRVGSPSLLSQCSTQQDELFELVRAALYNGASDDILKRMEITASVEDFLEVDILRDIMGDYSDALSAVGLLLDTYENAYDAIESVCNYLALKNTSENFKEILMDIYNDKSNKSDLRNAAKNCVKYLEASFGEMLGMTAIDMYAENTEVILNFVAEEAWSACMKACGLEAVTVAAKGIAFLMDKSLNMDASVAAFYQLTAAVKFEGSLRKIVSEKIDYLRCENMPLSPKYNDAIFFFECAILKGHEYTIDFYDACKTDFVDTSDIEFEQKKLTADFEDFEAYIDYRYDNYLENVK